MKQQIDLPVNPNVTPDGSQGIGSREYSGPTFDELMADSGFEQTTFRCKHGMRLNLICRQCVKEALD